jgi:Icc protein
MLRELRQRSSLNRVINSLIRIAAVPIVIGAAAFLFAQVPAPALHFVILGDRTGETVPGIYEAVWREVSAAKPDFVVGVGDSIQGLDDATAEKEWTEFAHVLAPFRQIPYFPAPGNHDVWSDASAKLFESHSGHPLHYSFDQGPAHFTVLDNSRSDALAPEEIAFLEQDLKAHEAQPVKFILSHRPSWLLNVVLRSPAFPFQQLAEKYGVHYVIAGHVHEMMHAALNGVEYISAPSAGGHLRASGQYQDGWFYGYIVVTVRGTAVTFEVRELPQPNGEARVTPLAAWGIAGLINKTP